MSINRIKYYIYDIFVSFYMSRYFLNKQLGLLKSIYRGKVEDIEFQKTVICLYLEEK